MCNKTANCTAPAHSFNKLELKCDKRQKTTAGQKSKRVYNDAQKLQMRKHFSFDTANRMQEQANALIEFNAIADTDEINSQDLVIPTYYLKKHLKEFESMRTCSNRIEVTEGKISKVFRCKNKLCPICSANKQGKLINRYASFFDMYKDDIYLVTLTFKNVKARKLNKACHDQKEIFSCIRRSMNRKLQRKGLSNMEGILKLEITYNQIGDDYHPHLHLVIVGKDNADAIPDAWMKKVSEYGYIADERAQDVRRCTDPKELFKYVTKLSYTTEKDEYLQKVLLRPLLNIYHSLSATDYQKAVRVISHFGVTTKELSEHQVYAEKIAPIVVDAPAVADAPAKDIEGSLAKDDFYWNLRANDYYSEKSGLLYGGLKLSDWDDSRFSYVEHTDLLSDETKSIISGKSDKLKADNLTVDNVFRTERMNKYYDDFRTDDEIKEHPHKHNLISYKLPKKELV